MAITSDPANETDRVRRYTPPEVLQSIEEQIERNVAYYSTQPDATIDERIEELKAEWSINRRMQANVATIGLAGSIMALFGKKRWAVLPATAFGFFFCHGMTGWAPVIPYLRRRGLRTRGEIDREIYALKVARGDFRKLPGRMAHDDTARQILDAVNR